MGINPCVDVPESVSQFFGKRGYVPVKGTLSGVPIRATLVPIGKGRHRLFINGRLRKRAGVDTGDRVNLVLEPDTEPRDLPVPDDLADALKAVQPAKEAFDRLPPSHKKEFITYLNYLKKPESRKRGIEKVIAQLTRPKDAG